MMALWVVLRAARPRASTCAAFRRSIEQQDVEAAEIRLETADLSSIETLVSELAHPEPRRVLYAIDLLESLDKRHLVTPLLLYARHRRRSRAGAARGRGGRTRPAPIAGCRASSARSSDHDGEVRVAAVRRWPRCAARPPST